MSLLAIYIYTLDKCLLKSFDKSLTRLFLLSCISSLYYLDINYLSNLWLANIFFQICELLLILTKVTLFLVLRIGRGPLDCLHPWLYKIFVQRQSHYITKLLSCCFSLLMPNIVVWCMNVFNFDKISSLPVLLVS